MENKIYEFLCKKCHCLTPNVYKMENIGTNKKIPITCIHCGHTQEVSVDINTDFIDYPLSLRQKYKEEKMEAEKQKYLSRLCDRINNSSKNIIYISQMDSYVENWLASEQATWIRKTWSGGTVYIPRYERDYQFVTARENARGYRAKAAIIDNRIPFDILQQVIAPTLITCADCRYF